jgi:hypothetical protein
MTQPEDTQVRKRGFLAWCHRYISFTLIGVTGLLCYMLFFTDSSVFDTYAQDREIERLKNEIRANRDTLQYYQQLNQRLATDPATMEQIVRENFHMQRSNEDVYLINQ